MKILFAHNNGDLYGSSRSMLRLATRLVRDGHEVRVLVPEAASLSAALTDAGAVVHVQRNLGVLDRATLRSAFAMAVFIPRLGVAVFQILRLLRRYRPDIVHTNTSVVIAPAFAARLAHVPHVWHVREFYQDFRAMWPVYRSFIRHFADRLVCVSEAAASQFRAQDSKVRVIHNGFPADEFVEVPRARTERFRTRLDLGERLVVGLVGRIKLRRKGQETFLRAAALLKTEYPDARFVLIGGPFPGNEDHLVELRRLAGELRLGESLVFAGEVEDIKAALAALDISVLASGQPEPFGGVVIESMALGKPVVGTDIGGTKEQIVHGETGFLVPPNDPPAMAAAIVQLLRNPELRARMGKKARSRFEQEFEFEAFYRRMMSTYADVGRLSPPPIAAYRDGA